MFIPVGFNLPFFKKPPVTFAIAAITGLIFFFLTLPEFSSGLKLDQTWTYKFAAIPGERFVWWTLLTYAFVHASVFHWLFNIWYLVIFGWVLESVWGSKKFLTFFLAMAMLSAIPELFLRWYDSFPIVGASGAIAACMGGVFLLYPEAKARLWIGILPFSGFPSTIFVSFRLLSGFWLAMQISGYLSHLLVAPVKIAYATHLSGFALGALVALFVKRYRKAFVNIDLSGRDLESLYRSMDEYARQEFTAANDSVMKLANAYRLQPGTQEGLFELSLKMKQKEVSERLFLENFAILRRRRLERWQSRYREVYDCEAPVRQSQIPQVK